MKSELVAMLIPENSPDAGLLVRRGDGQLDLGRIDVRVARAARAAAALRALELEEQRSVAPQVLQIKLV
jgi:hypothetical protein